MTKIKEWDSSLPSKKRSKKKKSKNRHTLDGGFIFAFMVFFIIMAIVIGFIFYVLIPDNEWFDEQVDIVKSTGWEPENSTVTYSSHHAKENQGEWKNLYCWIEYQNEPWNNTKGHIWYTDAGDWYFEEVVENG